MESVLLRDKAWLALRLACDRDSGRANASTGSTRGKIDVSQSLPLRLIFRVRLAALRDASAPHFRARPALTSSPYAQHTLSRNGEPASAAALRPAARPRACAGRRSRRRQGDTPQPSRLSPGAGFGTRKTPRRAELRRRYVLRTNLLVAVTAHGDPTGEGFCFVLPLLVAGPCAGSNRCP